MIDLLRTLVHTKDSLKMSVIHQSNASEHHRCLCFAFSYLTQSTLRSAETSGTIQKSDIGMLLSTQQKIITGRRRRESWRQNNERIMLTDSLDFLFCFAHYKRNPFNKVVRSVFYNLQIRRIKETDISFFWLHQLDFYCVANLTLNYCSV